MTGKLLVYVFVLYVCALFWAVRSSVAVVMLILLLLVNISHPNGILQLAVWLAETLPHEIYHTFDTNEKTRTLYGFLKQQIRYTDATNVLTYAIPSNT